MKKIIFCVVGLLVLVALGFGLTKKLYAPSTHKTSPIPPAISVKNSASPVASPIKPVETSPSQTEKVKLYNLVVAQKITSPFILLGEAPGTMFFEGSLPVKLYDQSGNILVITHAQAQEDWMTSDLVSFSVELKFKTKAERGVLVIEKDNPSGLLQNAEQFKIPVTF